MQVTVTPTYGELVRATIFHSHNLVVFFPPNIRGPEKNLLHVNDSDIQKISARVAE
jgi:hypothetical protein